MIPSQQDKNIQEYVTLLNGLKMIRNHNDRDKKMTTSDISEMYKMLACEREQMSNTSNSFTTQIYTNYQ